MSRMHIADRVLAGTALVREIEMLEHEECDVKAARESLEAGLKKLEETGRPNLRIVKRKDAA